MGFTSQVAWRIFIMGFKVHMAQAH